MSYAPLSPVAAVSAEREPLDERTVERWVWALLALGLAARLLRYLLRFPLWDDESFLMVSLIDRGYVDLMRPLEYHQMAPLLYLWLERACIDLFGFNEYAMRLVGLVSGIASLFLFRHVAKRLLSGAALIAAVGIFAVAYPCIRYSAEAKPYGSDLFVGLTIMALMLEWRRRPEQLRWIVGLTLLTPLLVGLSFPAAFVGGGLSLWMVPTLWQLKNRKAIAAWIVFNATLAGSFLGFFLLAKQNTSALSFMDNCWADAFPPVSEPWKLPLWFVQTNSGSWLSYPFGGPHGASTLTFLCVTAAVVTWFRNGNRTLAAFCLLPLALNLGAAAVHRYPYGGHFKLVHYTAGPICLMAGFGLVTALDRLTRNRASLLPALRGATIVLAVIAVGTMARDLYRPTKTLSDSRHRDFARWFWFNASLEGETCCVLNDLGLELGQGALTELNWTAMYLCNQEIYSPRRQKHEPIHWDRITADHPLRCVSFTTKIAPVDPAAEQTWLQEMQAKYDLASCETYPFSYFLKNERDLAVMDHLTIYRFVPKQTSVAAASTNAHR